MAARKQAPPDPPTQLTQLARTLEDDGLPRGVLLRGEERYFRDRALELLKARAGKGGLELCLHDAERGNPDFRLSALVDDLSGGGLFAARRLVVVRGGAELFQKSGKDPSPLGAAVTRFLEAEDDPGTVVLSVPSLRRDNPVVKKMEATGGRVLDLRKLWDGAPPWNPDPRQAELVRWALSRAREVGLRLTPDQAVYVCAATGNDLFALDDALARLKALPGTELARVLSWDAAAQPWAVADHLVAGDVPRGLAGVETLFHAGFQEKSGRRLVDQAGLGAMLLSALLRGVRRSLTLASELERGTNEKEAAARANVSGRAVGDAIASARRRSVGEWRGMLEDLAVVERRAKSAVGVDVNDFAALAVRWRGR